MEGFFTWYNPEPEVVVPVIVPEEPEPKPEVVVSVIVVEPEVVVEPIPEVVEEVEEEEPEIIDTRSYEEQFDDLNFFERLMLFFTVGLNLAFLLIGIFWAWCC